MTAPYIPYNGFVPGQTIQITIELDNISDVDVNYIRIRAERVITFSYFK